MYKITETPAQLNEKYGFNFAAFQLSQPIPVPAYDVSSPEAASLTSPGFVLTSLSRSMSQELEVRHLWPSSERPVQMPMSTYVVTPANLYMS